MNLCELENYFSSILRPQDFSNDISLNGLQIQNFDKNSTIKKVAFAVDACYETVEKAISIGSDALVCHHGIFWGSPLAISGSHYQLVKKALQGNLALFAYHIPLDANKEVGNNYGLARKIGLDNLEEFGFWRGMSLGVKGILSAEKTVDQIIELLGFSYEGENKILGALKFGKEKVKTVGIISGGACEDVEQAIDENLDLYITGEISHQIYHQCKENKINFVAGGHYNTGVMGVSLLAQKLQKETGIETIFIDIPTGL